MEILAFVHVADPYSEPRLGALLDDGRTVVDLEAAHFAMTEAPHPQLHSLTSFRQGGDHAREVAQRVVAWVRTQRPPGTTTSLERVRTLERTRA